MENWLGESFSYELIILFWCKNGYSLHCAARRPLTKIIFIYRVPALLMYCLLQLISNEPLFLVFLRVKLVSDTFARKCIRIINTQVAAKVSESFNAIFYVFLFIFLRLKTADTIWNVLMSKNSMLRNNNVLDNINFTNHAQYLINSLQCEKYN